MASAMAGTYPASKQTKILLVSEETGPLEALASALQELGQEIVVVRSVSDALGSLPDPSVTAVLVSSDFPEAEGYDVVRGIRALEGHAHTPVLFAGVMVDSVVDWIRHHTNLRENERSLRIGLESADLALWSIEPESGRVHGSARMREMFDLGDDAEAFITDWLERIAPEDREWVNRELQLALLGTAEFDCEFRVMPPDRNFRWIASRGNLLREGAGVAPGGRFSGCNGAPYFRRGGPQ